MHKLVLELALVLLLALHASATAATTTIIDTDNSDAELVHLFPEQPRRALRLPSGASQRFRVHALARAKVYDVKVSYPASAPAAFVLEVERVVAQTQRNGATTTTSARVLPVRRLNTAKLRLLPHELLQHKAHDDDPRVNVNTYRLALLQQQELKQRGDGGADLQEEGVAVDIVLRADAEGVAAVENSLRECVFDIVVEEMVLGGAFPLDTVALLAWLALVLAAAARWAFPYLLRKVALELPEEREVYARDGRSTDSHSSRTRTTNGTTTSSSSDTSRKES